jgi:hypothetical protein
MNLRVNYIPENWQPYNELAIMLWMDKMKINQYKN